MITNVVKFFGGQIYGNFHMSWNLKVGVFPVCIHLPFSFLAIMCYLDT